MGALFGNLAYLIYELVILGQNYISANRMKNGR